MAEIKRKRGRPIKEFGAKTSRLTIRTSEEENATIARIMEKTGLNESDAVRKALRLYDTILDFE